MYELLSYHPLCRKAMLSFNGRIQLMSRRQITILNYRVSRVRIILSRAGSSILGYYNDQSTLTGSSRITLLTLIYFSKMFFSSQLLSLSLPNLWVRSLFLAQVYLELQLHEEALEIYQAFMDAGFSRSNFIIAQIAIAHHNMRGQYILSF